MGYASLRTLAQIIDTVPGVSNMSVCKPFSGSGNVRAAFQFQGFEYVIMEPWGDSNEYWIGPAQEGSAGDITLIARSLENFKPSRFRKIWGNLWNLDLKALVGR